MKTVSVNELKPHKAQNPYYHQTGAEIFAKGEEITQEKIDCLKKAGIETLIMIEPSDDVREFIFYCRYTKLSIDKLPIGEILTSPVYDKNGTLLLEKGTRISQTIPTTFRNRGITEIYQRKNLKELGSEKVEKYRNLIKEKEGEHKKIPEVKVEIKEDRLIKDPSSITEENLEKNLRDPSIFKVKPEGPPLEVELKPIDKTRFRTEEEKKDFYELHKDAIRCIAGLFANISKGKNITSELISKVSGKVIGALIKDRDLLLNLVNIKGHVIEYILQHSINVTILSINIACALGYSKEQVFELAYGAFLHDIGMLRVPRHILTKNSKLTSLEKLQVQKHTIYGINLLQKVSGLPISTPYVSYQSHERINGSGYPKGKKGNVIHPFAKIVAVADSYEALISDRPYRKAYLPYYAMEQLIRMCSRSLLDSIYVRALLKYLSLFPIGSYIALSDGSIAKVVSSNPQDFTRPVVSIMSQNGKILETPIRVDLAEQKDIKVVKAVDGKSIEKGDIMKGF